MESIKKYYSYGVIADIKVPYQWVCGVFNVDSARASALQLIDLGLEVSGLWSRIQGWGFK